MAAKPKQESRPDRRVFTVSLEQESDLLKQVPIMHPERPDFPGFRPGKVSATLSRNMKRAYSIDIALDESATATADEPRSADQEADAQARALLRDSLAEVSVLDVADRYDVLSGLAKDRAKLNGGDLVRMMRRQSGNTLAQLQESYGIRPATISDIENARNPNGPDLWTLELLAHAMGKRLKIGFEDLE